VKGSLRERRPGNWELIVQLPRDAATGRTKQPSRMHQVTKRQAQRALAALVADVAAGKISSSSTTLDELLARWLDRVEDQLSPTTAREYRRIVTKMIGPDLDRTRLGKLTTQRIDAYYCGARSAARTGARHRRVTYRPYFKALSVRR
jgi:hypothetical protein